VNREKTVFLFPGAGVPPAGKELNLFLRHKEHFTSYFEKISSLTGINCAACLIEDRLQELGDLGNQFFTYAFSCALADLCKNRMIKPLWCCGYSMGIYTAYYVSGLYEYKCGISLIENAYKACIKSSSGKKGGLAAVVGLNYEHLKKIITKENFQSIYPALLLNNECFVFSGLQNELAAFMTLCSENGAYKVSLLPADLPYHHPVFLKDASERIREYLLTMDLKTPCLPVLSNISCRFIQSVEQAADDISSHLSNCIDWIKITGFLQKQKITCAIECGPGISITQNSRFIDLSTRYINIKNIKNRLTI